METITEKLTTCCAASMEDLMIRFGLNMIAALAMAGYLYYRRSQRKDYFFAFTLMSVAIFFLVYFMMGMERAKATMGVGLGLFGLLSIMRFRTDSMPVREMTYLFVIICLAVTHAMGDSYCELFAVDAVTMATVWILDMALKESSSKLIMYDDITKIQPEMRAALIEDLTARTGLKITKVEVGHIDFLRDMAMIRVFYEKNELSPSSTDIESMTKFPKED
jgi:hypothetical protein